MTNPDANKLIVPGSGTGWSSSHWTSVLKADQGPPLLVPEASEYPEPKVPPPGMLTVPDKKLMSHDVSPEPQPVVEEVSPVMLSSVPL
jgi:hypothetical protein